MLEKESINQELFQKETFQGLIALDVDGTLFDTKPGIIAALNKVLRLFGYSEILCENEELFIGPPIKTSLLEICGMDEKTAEEATRTYRKIYVEEFIRNSKPYCNLHELLKELHNRNYFIALATMKTGTQVEALVRGFALDEFDALKYALEDGSLSKRKMLEILRTQVDCDHYYMVGDTMGDFVAAKDAGYEFVYASYGYGNLSHENNDFVEIKQLHEILYFLK